MSNVLNAIMLGGEHKNWGMLTFAYYLIKKT